MILCIQYIIFLKSSKKSTMCVGGILLVKSAPCGLSWVSSSANPNISQMPGHFDSVYRIDMTTESSFQVNRDPTSSAVPFKDATSPVPEHECIVVKLIAIHWNI